MTLGWPEKTFWNLELHTLSVEKVKWKHNTIEMFEEFNTSGHLQPHKLLENDWICLYFQ